MVNMIIGCFLNNTYRYIATFTLYLYKVSCIYVDIYCVINNNILIFNIVYYIYTI